MAAIDLALTSGGRLIPTAAKFGVSKSALGRHRSSCLAGRLAAAAKSAAAAGEPPTGCQATPDEGLATLAEIGTAAGLTRKLVKTLDRLEQAAALAHDRQQFSGLSTLSAQILRGIETSARLHGLYAEAPAGSGKPGFQINIQVNAPEPRAADVGKAEARAHHPDRKEPVQVSAASASALRVQFDQPFTLDAPPDWASAVTLDRCLVGAAD